LTPFWPILNLGFACFAALFGFRGGFLTRFGPDFGRTFDSTFGPFLSVFAISAICLNLKQPRLEECPRGDDAAQQVVSDTHRSSLRDRECPRVDDVR